MSKTMTKLVVITFLTLAIAGCGSVDVHGGGRHGPDVIIGQNTGYYYLEDARYDYWWYYSDGSQWWHWNDSGWVIDSGFIWYDDSNWYQYGYDPFWYDPYYDPSGSIYYDDPYYWDDVYWDDDGYYGDDWYYAGSGDNVTRGDAS